MTLLPCPDCRRHLRADATTCPFCAAGVAGRLTRAVLFAGAIVSAAACGAAQTPPEEKQVIQNQPADAGAEELIAEEPPDAAVPMVPDRDDRRIRQKMPYGAPPTRDRLV